LNWKTHMFGFADFLFDSNLRANPFTLTPVMLNPE
jgi:hypothetical protein